MGGTVRCHPCVRQTKNFLALDALDLAPLMKRMPPATGSSPTAGADRPVHGFVSQDAGRRLRQIAILELRHAPRYALTAPFSRFAAKRQHVVLRLQCFHRKVVARLGRSRLAAEPGHRTGQHVRVLLVKCPWKVVANASTGPVSNPLPAPTP